MYSLVSESRFLSTKTSPKEFTTNNQREACVPSYFDSKLQELQNTNRQYKTSTCLDLNICTQTRTRSFFVNSNCKNSQPEEETSLISYYSRGRNLNPIGVIREDGEINKDDVEIENNLSRSFVCRHISKAWLARDLKLSKVNSAEDLRQSPMVLKNGDTPKGIKKSLDDIEDGIKICNLKRKDIFYIGLYAEEDIDNYFKQYLSKSEYAELLSLRHAYFVIENDECLEGVSGANSIDERDNELGDILFQIDCILENSKTLSIVNLMHIIHTSAPPIGKLASNSNNDDVYSFSKNSFQPLLRELCETIYNRPKDSSESFQWCTGNHAMGLKISKKDNAIKIRFYDPAKTISHNFILKSPKDANKITIPVLLSYSDQESHEIINNNITGYDDLHVNTLIHVYTRGR